MPLCSAAPAGPALGVELDNVIAKKGVEGVVNGMDVEEWNPALVSWTHFVGALLLGGAGLAGVGCV